MSEKPMTEYVTHKYGKDSLSDINYLLVQVKQMKGRLGVMEDRLNQLGLAHVTKPVEKTPHSNISKA